MTSNRLYDRISRDPSMGELRDGNTRLFLMRADAFMDAFGRLDEDARYSMFSAFAQSIAEHSGQSVKHYRHELGPAAREIFLNAAVNMAADMGWGGWAFGPNTPGEITLEVANSPFVEGHGVSEKPICAPILGMIEALGGIIFSVDPVVKEVECAAVTGGDTCLFVARIE